jgi:nitrate/TMAO reductase-like tetraheme cytochrome c subunit
LEIQVLKSRSSVLHSETVSDSVLCFLALAGPPAFASDPAEYYGTRFLTALLIIGIALLLFSLLRYRGRTPGPAAWVLLFVSVVVLPGVSTMFGTILVFERGESVEFCGSCHRAMKPYVADMRDPSSNSLAAIHFKNSYIPRNQCYTCHSSFGLFGTLQAKLNGIIEVHRYYTNSFSATLKMREPYRNDDCLKCHAGSVKWSGNHATDKEEIFAGRRRCLDCHSLTRPPHNLRKTT